MKNFYLFRKEDESGVSGLGFVAEGVGFTNGKICMAWRTDKTSVAVYDDMDTLLAIHGHGGKTDVVWDDVDFVDKTTGHPIVFAGTGWSNMKTNEWLGWIEPLKEWVRPSVFLANLEKEINDLENKLKGRLRYSVQAFDDIVENKATIKPEGGEKIKHIKCNICGVTCVEHTHPIKQSTDSIGGSSILSCVCAPKIPAKDGVCTNCKKERVERLSALLDEK